MADTRTRSIVIGYQTAGTSYSLRLAGPRAFIPRSNMCTPARRNWLVLTQSQIDTYLTIYGQIIGEATLSFTRVSRYVDAEGNHLVDRGVVNVRGFFASPE